VKLISDIQNGQCVRKGGEGVNEGERWEGGVKTISAGLRLCKIVRVNWTI